MASKCRYATCVQRGRFLCGLNRYSGRRKDDTWGCVPRPHRQAASFLMSSPLNILLGFSMIPLRFVILTPTYTFSYVATSCPLNMEEEEKWRRTHALNSSFRGGSSRLAPSHQNHHHHPFFHHHHASSPFSNSSVRLAAGSPHSCRYVDTNKSLSPCSVVEQI